MKHFFVILVTYVFACATCTAAQVPAGDKVDAYVESEMAKQHIPGLQLGVYRDGEIIKAKGYGLSNVELNVPVKPETIFQSGSIGKQFVATAVMMLVEEGRMDLNGSITKYFPDAPPGWRHIKVRNLLSHTSGLAEYESDENTKPGGPINLRQDYTEGQLVKFAESLPMDFQPGEKWDYRNTNYLLLGVIIHKVTGEFYEDFLQKRIFRPLGMASTRIISDAHIVPNRAAGYRLLKGELKNQEWVSTTFDSTADGTLYLNVLDLARWDGALYTERLLKRSSFEQVWTVAKLNSGRPNEWNYGFGWLVNEINGHRVIEHSGSWQGFTAFIARYLDDKLTVVVLTNLDSAHSVPGRIAHQIASLYNPQLTPVEPKPIEDQEPQVTAFVKSWLENIAAGKADPKDFSPEVRADWFPKGVKQVEDHTKSLGSLRFLDLLERKQDGGQQEYTYRATFETLKIVYCITLNHDNKIVGFRPCKN